MKIRITMTTITLKRKTVITTIINITMMIMRNKNNQYHVKNNNKNSHMNCNKIDNPINNDDGDNKNNNNGENKNKK